MKKYIVALQCGGLMEDPHIRYEDKEIIEANSRKEAESIYNKKHHCSFFYAHCLGEVKGKKVTVDVEDLQ